MTCDFIEGSIPTKERNIRCSMCGYYITNQEYGGMFNGNYVDFTSKKVGSITMCFCNECMAKIIEFSE